MSKASITIEDADDTVIVSADFGDEVDQDSQAHGMVMTLLESVLRTAKTYTSVEDTIPEVDVEPGKIVLPEDPA